MGSTTSLPPRDRGISAAGTALAVALVLVYAVVAVVLAGATVVVAFDSLRWPLLLIVAAFAATAYAVERGSQRAANPLVKNAAPALYLVAALLLPAPAATLIAAGAVAGCHLTWSGAPALARLAATAHTTVAATLTTALAYLACGDERLIHAMVILLSGRGWPLHLTLQAPIHGISGGTGLANVIALVPAYYVLDTLPSTLLGALFCRTSPWRAWRDLYGRTVLADVAVPSLGVLAAVTYSMSTHRAVAVLAVPLGLALFWTLERVAAPERAADAPVATTGQIATSDDETRLSVVLRAVRALGGDGELAAATATLARAAVGLTRFRSCVVYLYESHDGTFRPYACNDEKHAATWAEIPRDTVEALMCGENMLGYSYYARAPRQDAAAPGRWRVGDALLVPLLLKTSDVMGFLWLESPSDGQAPLASDLGAIETVAALGAGVVDRLRQTHEVLRLAQTDGLTGLLNRRAFEERLAGELEGPAFRRPVALMMIDLDDFSAINNTYGHQIGDEALRLVAGVVRSHLREGDAGGRYGGDEFVVILPGLDATAALDVAERVRAALVEATTRAAAEGRLPHLHTSIGVAVCPQDGTAPDALVKAADDALYSSKRLGKNRVSLRGAA